MGETDSGTRACTFRLILIPAVITLAVTILRLVGELQHWSPRFFDPAAGGGGAIIGIVWLVPVFGIYFSLELARTGQAPRSRAKAIAYTVLGLIVGYIGVRLTYTSVPLFPGNEVVGYVLMVAAPVLLLPAWPALFKTLLAYAYAARVPVAIVMFLAIRGNWGTHYDAAPGFPAATGF